MQTTAISLLFSRFFRVKTAGDRCPSECQTDDVKTTFAIFLKHHKFNKTTVFSQYGITVNHKPYLHLFEVVTVRRRLHLLDVECSCWSRSLESWRLKPSELHVSREHQIATLQLCTPSRPHRQYNAQHYHQPKEAMAMMSTQNMKTITGSKQKHHRYFGNSDIKDTCTSLF